ncbi:hypothetical protein N8I74_15865 [Chitiniphilus purpureus]|uniref:Uncharacterized protein n=1 Tax=Chitiniphilus purpureus TaxID=2981137 RepID=A0ABY6DK92_9NEIS|nr:hypothetical protein [Chitiniphilus sp. CD1]UXY14780.1 hypothetical protein N8I74_15865 [Chitiniphilus sp. CD1]
MVKRRPSGFCATCQCGVVIGALDAKRTARRDMGQILGKWLFDGCTVRPYFDGTWSIEIRRCECDAAERQGDSHD